MLTDLEKQMQSALRPEVPAGADDRILANVMANAEHLFERQHVIQPVRRRRFRWLRPVAIAIVPVLLLGGTALASSRAQPDSLLYPVKEKAEDARVFLAFQDLDRARAETRYAGERLDEIEEMLGAGKPESVPGLISGYDDRMAKAEAYRDSAANRGEDTTDIDDLMAATRARHDEILRGMLSGSAGDLPEEVVDMARRIMGADEAMSGNTSVQGSEMQSGATPMAVPDGSTSMDTAGGQAPMGGSGGQTGSSSGQVGGYGSMGGTSGGGSYMPPAPSSGMGSGSGSGSGGHMNGR